MARINYTAGMTLSTHDSSGETNYYLLPAKWFSQAPSPYGCYIQANFCVLAMDEINLTTKIRVYLDLVSVKTNGSGSALKGYINGIQLANTYTSISSGQSRYMGSVDMTINHNQTTGQGVQNITYSVVSVWNGLGSCEESATVYTNTYPRASSVGCTDGNIESTVAISINRASDTFKHTLRYIFGSLSGTIATGIGTSYGWTLPSSFYSQIPNAKSGIGTIYCDTYSGGTLIGTSSCGFTAYTNEAKCKPDVSATIIDSNDTTYALTNDRNKFIKGYSNAKVTISATAMPVNLGSTITSRKVTCGDGKEGYGTEVTLNGIDSGNFTVSATDSRGYSNSKPYSKTLIPYVKLTLNPTFYRPEPTTGEVKLKYDGNYFAGSFGATNNSLTIKYRYKESTKSSWDGIGYTEITSTIDSTNNRYSNEISLGTGFDYQKSYDFEIVAIDKLNNIPKTAHVSEGIPMLALFKDHLEAFGSEFVNNRNGFVSISSGIGVDNYSTDEIIVGKWIDGKPIYRKVITGNWGAITDGVYTNKDVTIPNFKRLIRICGTDLIANATNQQPFLLESTLGYRSQAYYTNGNIRIRCNNSQQSNCDFYVIVDYTKTTD